VGVICRTTREERVRVGGPVHKEGEDLQAPKYVVFKFLTERLMGKVRGIIRGISFPCGE